MARNHGKGGAAKRGDNAILGGAGVTAGVVLTLTFGAGLNVLVALGVGLALGGAATVLLWPESKLRKRLLNRPDGVGYDAALMVAELEQAEADRTLLRHVVDSYPRHPVSRALDRIAALVGETLALVADEPDRYRALRPMLVTHLSTAADIARLVDRIKATGETLDDPQAVAARLEDLALLMKDARRRSTRAEQDRLDAQMRLIDNDLHALAMRRSVEDRLTQATDRKTGDAAGG